MPLVHCNTKDTVLGVGGIRRRHWASEPSPSDGMACGNERGGALASTAAASARSTRCGLLSTLTFILQQARLSGGPGPRLWGEGPGPSTHLQMSAASAPSLVTSARQNSCTCNRQYGSAILYTERNRGASTTVGPFALTSSMTLCANSAFLASPPKAN